jgi:hypothetical protein|tara:strand:+ start:3621 stop:4268 length:648 start_codon:yes stop_codon:yes gene_type:complete
MTYSEWLGEEGERASLENMKAVSKYNPPPTNASGFSALVPKEVSANNEYYDVTVLTVGGKGWAGIVVAALHLICWIVTLILTGATTASLSGAADANDAAKTTSILAFATHWFIIISIVCHAAFCQKGERGAAVATVFLIAFLLLGLLLNASVFTYCMVLGNKDAWGPSVATMVFSVLSSSMVFAFVVEWSNRGTMVFTSIAGEQFGGGVLLDQQP